MTRPHFPAVDPDTKLPSAAVLAAWGAGLGSGSTSLINPITGWYHVRQFGAVPDGVTDSTAAFQAAVDAAAADGGGTVWVDGETYAILANEPATATGNYLRDEGGVALKDNVHLLMDPRAILKAITTSQNQYNVLRCYNKTNVRITGGTVQGERATHIGSTGEWGYGLAITAGSNITVEGTRFIDCWGDGVNIQVMAGTPTTPAKNVVLRGITCHNNRRQGMSIEGVDGLLVDACTFSSTAGTAPQCGVDIEPWNSANTVQNIEFRSCKFTDNTASGLLATVGVKNLIVDGCTFTNNGTTSDGQLTTYLSASFGGITVVRNAFQADKSTQPSMLIQGGVGYLISANTMINGIVVSTGPSTSPASKLTVSDNTIRFASGTTPKSDAVIVASAQDVVVRNNTFDATAVENSRSLLRLESCTKVDADSNRFVGSPRSVSITGSADIHVRNSVSDNPGIDFVDVGATSSRVRIEGNTVYGPCHDNSGSPAIYCSGTVSGVEIRNNFLAQAPRISTAGQGSGWAGAGFGTAAGVALDTTSSNNRLVNDGTHTFPFFASGTAVATTGYLGEVTGSPRPDDIPTGWLAHSFTRAQGLSAAALESGRLHMAAVWLNIGTTVTSVKFFSSSTALAGPSHGWGALFSPSRALLGQSTNDTGITWAANAEKTFTLGTPVVTTESGWFYVGVCVVASTMPTMVCTRPDSGGTIASTLAPAMGGRSTTGLTTTAPNPAGAPTTSFIPYGGIA